MRIHRSTALTFTALRSRLRGTVRRNAAPKGYTATGVPVEIKVGGKYFPGVIEKQVFSGPGAMFKVRLKGEINFFFLSDRMGKYGPAREALMAEYERVGCLKYVKSGGAYIPIATCMWARWGDLRVPVKSLKKGMPVELVVTNESHVSSITDYPVRFIKWVKSKSGGRAPLVWFPEPMTYYDIKKIYAWDDVRPENFSKHVYMMRLEQYHGIYKAGLKPPPARPRRVAGVRFMEFIEPVPIKVMVDKYLRPYYHLQKAGDIVDRRGNLLATGKPHLTPGFIWGTILTMVVFHMAPIKPERIQFRPMREDLFYGLVVPAEAAFGNI